MRALRRASSLLLLPSLLLFAPAGARAEGDGPGEAFRAATRALPAPSADRGFVVGGPVSAQGGAEGQVLFEARPAEVGGEPGWRVRDEVTVGDAVTTSEALLGADLSPREGTLLRVSGAGAAPVRLTWARTGEGFRLREAAGASRVLPVEPGTPLVTTVAGLLLFARLVPSPAPPARYAAALWRPEAAQGPLPLDLEVESVPDADGARRLDARGAGVALVAIVGPPGADAAPGGPGASRLGTFESTGFWGEGRVSLRAASSVPPPSEREDPAEERALDRYRTLAGQAPATLLARHPAVLRDLPFDTLGLAVLFPRVVATRADGEEVTAGAERAGEGRVLAEVHPYRLRVESVGDGAGGADAPRWRAVDELGEGEDLLVEEVWLTGDLTPVRGSLRATGGFAGATGPGDAATVDLRWRREGPMLGVTVSGPGGAGPASSFALPLPDAPLVVSHAQAVLLARLATQAGQALRVVRWRPGVVDPEGRWAAWRLAPSNDVWDGWPAHVVSGGDGVLDRVSIALDPATDALMGLEVRGAHIATQHFLRMPLLPPPEARPALGEQLVRRMDTLPPGSPEGLVLARRAVALQGATSASLFAALADAQLLLARSAYGTDSGRERARLAWGAADAYEAALGAPDDRGEVDPALLRYRLGHAFLLVGALEAVEAVAHRLETEDGAPPLAVALRALARSR